MHSANALIIDLSDSKNGSPVKVSTIIALTTALTVSPLDRTTPSKTAKYNGT